MVFLESVVPMFDYNQLVSANDQAFYLLYIIILITMLNYRLQIVHIYDIFFCFASTEL